MNRLKWCFLICLYTTIYHSKIEYESLKCDYDIVCRGRFFIQSFHFEYEYFHRLYSLLWRQVFCLNNYCRRMWVWTTVGTWLVFLLFGTPMTFAQTENASENEMSVTSIRNAPWIDSFFPKHSVSSAIANFDTYGGEWKLLRSDDWTNADSSKLEVATPNASTEFSADDMELWSNACDGPKMVFQNTVLSQGELSVEVWIPDVSEGNAGVMIQVSELGVGADRWTGYEIALDAAAQNILFGKHEQNFTPIQRIPCSIPIKRWVQLGVKFNHGDVEIFVNGTSVYRGSDTQNPLQSGAIGLRPWQKVIGYRRLKIRNTQESESADWQEIPFQSLVPTMNEQIADDWFSISSDYDKCIFEYRYTNESSGNGVQKVTRLSHSSTDSSTTSGVYGIGCRGTQSMENMEKEATPSNTIPWKHGQIYRGYLWCHAVSPTLSLQCVAVDDVTQNVIGSTDLIISKQQDNLLSTIEDVNDVNAIQCIPFAIVPEKDTEQGHFELRFTGSGSIELTRLFLDDSDENYTPTLSIEKIQNTDILNKRVSDDLYTRVIFLTRYPLSSPNSVGLDLWQAQPRKLGCSIRVIDLGNPQESVQTIFSDATGCIYDMNLSLDAQTIYFSYTRQSDGKYRSIWKIGVDGTGLTRLTDGPFYDVSPCELADGTVVFVSTRSTGYTVCQPGPASNLYRMNADGSHLQCVSMNTLSDMSPQLLPDGRILFTRWEYIDRDLTYRQSLWTQHPDGSNYRLYFGNTIRDVGTFWQARPLPDENGLLSTDRVVATFAPHHGFPHGAIGIIDQRNGLETSRDDGYTYITKEIEQIADTAREWSYRDPFPLTNQTFLASHGNEQLQRFRLILLDRENRRRLLYEDPEQSCFFPILLKKYPSIHDVASLIPPVENMEFASPKVPTGTFLLSDVYQGLPTTIPRGEAKTLRIMEQVRKSEDLVNRAFDQSPVMSYGTYYAKRCWSEVPIEEDGSAYFEAPAMREIYFQILDEHGMEMHRMTSGVQIMPHEKVSCIGCHEPRNTTISVQMNKLPLAAQKSPYPVQMPESMENSLTDGIIDYTKLVQPILDKYCTSCHSGGDPMGGYDLSGDKTRYFNMSYDQLLGHSRSYRQHDMQTGEMKPEEAAKGTPLVHFYWLLWTPTAVHRPLQSGAHASRLPDYFTKEHCGKSIPEEDLRKIWLWMDANVPYYATYAHSRPNSPGRRDRWTNAQTGEMANWYVNEFSEVYKRRCDSCHGPIEGTTNWEGRYAWINLTHPENSSALTTHLSRSAGGRGISIRADAHELIFQDRTDPDYQKMRKAIQQGRIEMFEQPEADMSGFRRLKKEW